MPQTTAPAAQLGLTPEDSYNVLVAQVHAPVFFNKLAQAYGIEAKSQEDARELLMLCGELRNVHEQELHKQASAGTSFINEARHDLQAVMGNHGYVPIANDVSAATYQQHAKAAAQNPLVKEAAAVFSNFLTKVS